ncbi:hypothetical protein ABD86_18665 [Paenibacillus alvei]|nr:hypothetical protein [Paenibacillus alvei]MBG9745875.1 hypothetical protein [Paenibacillus alvei]
MKRTGVRRFVPACQIFSSFEVPIFFKSVSLQGNFQHFNLDLISTDYAKEVALDIARMSKSY